MGTSGLEDLGLLTDAEHELLDDLTKVANGFAKVIGEGPSAVGDRNEAVGHIHVLQNMVLAQAAARTYPARYRLMGGSFR